MPKIALALTPVLATVNELDCTHRSFALSMSQRTDAARGARLAGLARGVLALFARRGRGCGGGGRVQVVARGGPTPSLRSRFSSISEWRLRDLGLIWEASWSTYVPFLSSDWKSVLEACRPNAMGFGICFLSTFLLAVLGDFAPPTPLLKDTRGGGNAACRAGDMIA